MGFRFTTVIPRHNDQKRQQTQLSNVSVSRSPFDFFMRYLVQQLYAIHLVPRILPTTGGHPLFDVHTIPPSTKVTGAPRNRLCHFRFPSRITKNRPIRSTLLSNSQSNKSHNLIYYQENVVAVICPVLRVISSPSSGPAFSRGLTNSCCIMITSILRLQP